MKNKIAIKEFPEQRQRLAVAYSQFRSKKESLTEAVATKQTIDGINVELDDYDIELREDHVVAYMRLSSVDNSDVGVELHFEYNDYVANAEFSWEPDTAPTYVPYGEIYVMYDNGKGSLDSVHISEMVPEDEVYKLDNGDQINREEVLQILQVNEEQLQKLEKAARKLASDVLRKRVAQYIADDSDYWPERNTEPDRE